MVGQNALKQPIRAAIHIIAAHNVIARFEHQHQRGCRAQTGSERQAVFAFFQRRQTFLQGRAGRIIGPRIFVAAMFAYAFLSIG